MTHSVKIFLVAAVVFIVFSEHDVSAQAMPKAAKLLPPETVFLIDIDNFQQLKSQFEKTSLYKLYKDPAMTAFVEDLKSKWRREMTKLDKSLPQTVIDEDILPQGRVCFALVLNRRSINANEPTALFIIQFGRNISKIEAAVETSISKTVEQGGHLRSEDYRGHSIKTVTGKDSSRLGYGFSSVLNYCFINDCIVGSEDIELLKFAISRLSGAGSASLADDADYSAVMAATGPYHDIDLYVNIKQLIKTAASEDSTGKTRANITALGLDNAASAGLSLAVARRPGTSWSGKAFLKLNGAKKGILKILEFKSSSLKAPAFVPASAYSLAIVNIDIRQAYNELYNILTAINPGFASMMNVPLVPPAEPQGRPQVMLKNDVIDHLGSQIAISQSWDKSQPGSYTPDCVFAVEISNRSAIEKSLSLLHSSKLAYNNPDARRQLLGYTIYIISPMIFPWFRPGPTPMEAPVGTDTKQMPNPAFTVTDTHIIFGIESTVEKAVRTLASPATASITSAKWFQNAKLSLPAVAGLVGLEDVSKSSELLWHNLKQIPKTAGVGTSPHNGPDATAAFKPPGFDFLDHTLLPEFKQVQKYFGSSAFYGISRPDGFFFEFMYLTPMIDK